jgi:GAF domain-containing protein
MTDHSALLDAVRRILASGRRVDEKTEEICRTLQTGVPGYDIVSFYVVDPENPRQLVRAVHTGAGRGVDTIPFGQGLCGQVAERGISVVVGDVSQELNYVMGHEQTRSEMVLPVFRSGQVVAALDVNSFTVDRFGSDDRLLLEEICLLLTDRV